MSGLDPRSRIARELPLGAIRPGGWARDQLELQARNITGRLEQVWPDVGADSGWLGGTGEDWERGPYYLDGLVALAWTLDDPHLIALAKPWIEWMLASQRDDGFFGPATNGDWWPRMVAVKAIEQYADATDDPRVQPFLARWFAYQAANLVESPLASWGRARGADNVLGVWWLYERTGDEQLLPLIDLLLEQTTDWDDYLGSRLITGPARAFSHLTHGPNVAMGLKTGAAATLRDTDPATVAARRAATERSFAALDRWHGQAHGTFSGDEWLGGRDATAGVETCQVVELLYTLERLSEIFGGGDYGDRIEELAFSLLPASSDPELRGHQYHQQANQVRVSVGHRPWTHSSDDANIFGLEPHFGCCTANLHQGWPKLVRSSWVVDGDDALRVVTYLPCTVDARLDDVPVRLVVDTHYPFEETVRVRLESDAAATGAIRMRIPAWATDWRLSVAGAPVDAAPVDGYVTVDRTWRPGDEIELTLPMRPRVERREGQSASVRLGPLAMVLRIPENWIEVQGAPGIGEWEVHPRTSWNFALADVAGAADWEIRRRPPGPVPFRLEDAPVEVATVGAHVHGWGLDGDQAGPVPSSPVKDVGPILGIRLVPYGSARLRVTEFPTLAASDEFEE